MTTRGRGAGGMLQKKLKSKSSEMRFPVFGASKSVLFLEDLNISVAVVIVVLLFSSVAFLFSLMKSKQMAVRGPTGGGRPPVTSFY